jgi:hypothetical protein
MPLIDTDEFEKRYREFEKLDFANRPHTFHDFWRRKLAIEKQEAHLLDVGNINETLSKLGPVLKIWLWHRPYEFEYCFERFKTAIVKIPSSYDKIRKFTLLEFNQAPREELEKIWDEFGAVKPQGEYDEGELVMTITKPLMFLWGQTPAFDLVVRGKMPIFDVKGFRYGRWEFDTWIDVMKKLQKYLIGNANVLDSFKKTSIDKYGTDVEVPYGQFFDLYYWTKDEKESCSKDSTSAEEGEPITDFEKDLQKDEFRNFIDLLDNLKNNARITAEDWREYRKQWTEYPQSRSSLIERLKRL